MFRIPLAKPDLTGNEERYVVDAVRSSWIGSSGPYLDRFEREFATLCGTADCIGVTNGTVALHLAMLGLGLGPGDEVIVPSLTYVATANAVRYVGAEPVFVDVDPATWTIDPTLIENAITPRTRGIVAVHLYGHPADMDAINRVAGIHGLWVVEDAAEAPFARYRGRPTGSLAKVATFSFYGNKVISSGEGGALTVDDGALDLRLRTLRGQGVDPVRRYFFPVTGYNFRMTNVAAAFLCAQLERAEAMLRDRWRVYERYAQGLKDVPGIALQPIADWAELSPWLYSVTIDAATYGRTRDEAMQLLSDQGIDTRPFFIPLHQLPPFRTQSRSRGEHLPLTDQLGTTGINLPTYVGLSDTNVDEICEVLRDGAR